MAIRVLVADGQPLLSECLVVALAQWTDLQPIDDRPASGLDVIEAVLSHQPDVALVDYWMPGIDGPDASGAVLYHLRGFKVIFLSWFFANRAWFDAPGDIERTISDGAVGFLPKHCRVATVVEAIERAHAGERPVFGDELEKLVARMRNRRQVVDKMWPQLARLTPREIEVLELLANGVSVKEAAENLFVSPATLRTHVQRILQKTGTHSQAAAIATARNYGIIRV